MKRARFLLVLHGHIPDVVGHGVWPHGINWLYEAAAETYLPLLDMPPSAPQESIQEIMRSAASGLIWLIRL